MPTVRPRVELIGACMATREPASAVIGTATHLSTTARFAVRAECPADQQAAWRVDPGARHPAARFGVVFARILNVANLPTRPLWAGRDWAFSE